RWNGRHLTGVGYRNPAQLLHALGERTQLTLQRREVQRRRSFGAGREVHARAVVRPRKVRRRLGQAALPETLRAAVTIHQVQIRQRARLVLVVVARVRDPAAVGGHGRVRVRTLPLRQRLDRSSGDVDGVDLAVVAQILGARLARAGDIQRLAVGGPFGVRVVVLARRDLPRRAADRRVYDEHVRESFFDGSDAVPLPGQPIDDRRALGPFGAARPLRQLDLQDGILVGDRAGERDPPAVGRPPQAGRRAL